MDLALVSTPPRREAHVWSLGLSLGGSRAALGPPLGAPGAQKEVTLDPARISQCGALTPRKQPLEPEQKPFENWPLKGGRGRKETPTKRQARPEPGLSTFENWRLKRGSGTYVPAANKRTSGSETPLRIGDIRAGEWEKPANSSPPGALGG